MSDIVIRGMEMPKNSEVLFVRISSDGRALIYKGSIYTDKNDLHYDIFGKATEIEGRAVDADKLLKEQHKVIDGCMTYSVVDSLVINNLLEASK